ncbi:integrase core domain-containing protein [Candidatus Rariloculus sp.]|uniref:integrase core domain-containing protein n=1 Tax=Candidatus Rariloculus sp. TaxID=3101265 RepID=UPI003D0C0A1D
MQNLDDRLAEWQFHYNWRQPHGALGGKTPMEVACDSARVDPALGRCPRALPPGKGAKPGTDLSAGLTTPQIEKMSVSRTNNFVFPTLSQAGHPPRLPIPEYC